MSAHRTLEERFWEKVDKRGPDECWEWLSAKTPRGYGKIGLNLRTSYAHRISYILEYGSIPDNLLCLHKCDNPGCVNPRHLFVGTQTDNMRDMSAKKRWVIGKRLSGEDNPSHRLTAKQVVEMRRIRHSGARLIDLAELFGVSISCVASVVRNKTWKAI